MVDFLNLAAANFNFPSIFSSKSLSAEKSNLQSCGKSEQKYKRAKISSRNSRKNLVQLKKGSPLVHSSRKSRQKLSAVAVGERQEEEKKVE